MKRLFNPLFMLLFLFAFATHEIGQAKTRTPWMSLQNQMKKMGPTETDIRTTSPFTTRPEVVTTPSDLPLECPSGPPDEASTIVMSFKVREEVSEKDILYSVMESIQPNQFERFSDPVVSYLRIRSASDLKKMKFEFYSPTGSDGTRNLIFNYQFFGGASHTPLQSRHGTSPSFEITESELTQALLTLSGGDLIRGDISFLAEVCAFDSENHLAKDRVSIAIQPVYPLENTAGVGAIAAGFASYGRPPSGAYQWSEFYR